MSMIAFLITLIKELLPFLKEALLEGQSFKVWLKTNWHTFACLVVMLFMTFIVAFLAESLTIANQQLVKSQQVVDSVKTPLTTLVQEYQTLHTENKRLQQDVEKLQLDNMVQNTKLGQYEEWMGQCGVNITTGQCRVVKHSSPVKPSAGVRRKP